MTLMRGCLEDAPLFEWLDEVWRLEKHIDPEAIYWGTKLACIEMIKCGVTCFLDLYWFIDTAVKAVEETGMRANLSYTILGGGDAEKEARQVRECQEIYEKSKSWSDRVQFSVGIHAGYTVAEETMLWATNFAVDHDLLIHTHLSETEKEVKDSIELYGVSPVKRFKRLGMLSDRVIAAHGVWLDEEDIEILGNRRVTITHNINSNLKLSSGYKFKYKELKAAGANVVFGTDGTASSNNLDVLESMKTSALMQKAWRKDPGAMPLQEIMDMATKDSAKALRINSGEIVEGKLADIVLINTRSAAFTPNYNFLANLIYSANSSCVDTVICDGKVIMRNRVIPGEEEVLENAARMAAKLAKNL
jgi:5-methylthioadenosine/S-adenosylhomocysteine deaminase